MKSPIKTKNRKNKIGYKQNIEKPHLRLSSSRQTDVAALLINYEIFFRKCTTVEQRVKDRLR